MKHGMSSSRTYKSWTCMKYRCSENAEPHFKKYYWDRGVKVCARWNDFRNFLSDMGERPERTSIDRIDGTGNYEPGNCRWATWDVQTANKRMMFTARMITLNDKTKPVRSWAKDTGIHHSVILRRLKRGLSQEKALTTPTDSHYTHITFQGITRSMIEWSRFTGLKETTLWTRKKLGWSIAAMLTTPARIKARKP